jgi:CheY-like chemotaxis protein
MHAFLTALFFAPLAPMQCDIIDADCYPSAESVPPRHESPMSDATPPAASNVESKPQLAPTSSLDVLIIDDDELTSARLEILVEACGHGALSVASVEEAQHAMRAVYFPILIVDRMLGDGDGIDLCREYRARHPQNGVYIIILSALDSAADVNAGLIAGADDYVSKRSTDPQLIQRLRKAAAAMKLTPK